MTKVISLCAAIVILLCLRAEAIDFGLYGSLGSGTADWKGSTIFSGYQSYQMRSRLTGAGCMIDTAVAPEGLFNYRLNAGYEALVFKSRDAPRSIRMNSLVVDQDFGFAIQEPGTKHRIWIGPELRVAYARGRSSLSTSERFTMIGLGLGPAIGVNIRLADSFPVSFKASYLWTEYSEPLGDYYDGRSLAFGMAVFFR